MKPKKILLFMVFTLGVIYVGFYGLASHERDKSDIDVISVQFWQRMASPGSLSRAHAFLENNCAACHTPNKGVEAQNCIVCHANNQSLLQRQPTAFHANISSCVECHSEHLGLDHRPTQMDHTKLAQLGFRMTAEANANSETNQIASWIGPPSTSTSLPPGHPIISPQEGSLSCIACHSNQDRHQGLFGTNCIQCHATTAWTVPEFRHPAPTSTNCVQCHQAPPSHYMMHFQMVSMKIAGQEHAEVSDCFKCHQTTSWNDIKGVGWYKHH